MYFITFTQLIGDMNVIHTMIIIIDEFGFLRIVELTDETIE